MSHAQIGYNIMCMLLGFVFSFNHLIANAAGLAQAGPLSLLIAVVQFTAPHAYLSTSTGLALSARAIGGASPVAVINEC